MLTEDITKEAANPISHDEIRAELGRILESASFRSSARCQDFLRHVVEQTLTDGVHGLKERTIGVELFGRAPTYDTSTDGIVRIRASEVRKRLALYYADAGKTAAIHITLPLGSYLPVISRTHEAPDDNETPVADGAEPDLAPKANEDAPFSKLLSGKRIGKVILIALAPALIIFGVLAGWNHFLAARDVSNLFWQPLVGNSEPVQVVTSYTPVYLPPARANNASNPANPNDTNAAPYRLMTDRYVGGGDLVAAVLVSSMLTSTHHPYNLKLSTSITLDDLRDKPAVLIGYASTQWSDITKNFRFFVQRGMVTDRGQDTNWRPLHQGEDNHVEDDYAIISRAYNPETHSMIVLVSGCTGYGTEEAARLVTDPKQLAVALSGAPKDWQQKNMQLVLHIEVVAKSPANAQVVAQYYW